MYSSYPQPDQSWACNPAVNSGWAVTFGLLTAIVVLNYLRSWRRDGDPIGLILVVGGALASVIEPMLDVLGLAFHPRNQPVLFTIADRPMPLWLVFLYMFFHSTFTILVWRRLQAGGGARSLWPVYGGVFAFDVVMETIGLKLQVWYYFGEQPLALWNFPLWWASCNALGPIVTGVLVYLLRERLRGWWSLALVAVPIVGFTCAYAIAATPVWAVLSTDLPATATWSAGIVTVALGIAGVWVLGEVADVIRNSRRLSPAGVGSRLPDAETTNDRS